MDNSPLSRLPQEPCNRIYELVLVRQSAIKLCIPRTGFFIMGSIIHPVYWATKSNVGFLRTCKSIHSEALAIFLGANTFAIQTIDGCALSDFRRFLLDALPARARRLVRSVEISPVDPGHLKEGDIHSLVERAHEHLSATPNWEVVVNVSLSKYNDICCQLRLTSATVMSEAITYCLVEGIAAAKALQKDRIEDMRKHGISSSTVRYFGFEVTARIERFQRLLVGACSSLREIEARNPGESA